MWSRNNTCNNCVEVKVQQEKASANLLRKLDLPLPDRVVSLRALAAFGNLVKAIPFLNTIPVVQWSRMIRRRASTRHCFLATGTRHRLVARVDP
jgi:hypothetical protein